MEHGTEQVTERGTGVTVRHAAERLGISERAVRARIKRGTLAAEQVPGGNGPVWRVFLDAEQVTSHGTEHGTEHAVHAWEQERAALLAQVEWLRGQVEQATERHAAAEQEWRRILEQEQHTRAALIARRVPQIAPPEPEPETPAPAAQAVPWWAFWRRGV